jgi:MFS family permease
MRSTFHMLRAEPAARPFFAAYAQSALGSGAAIVALLVLAYERLASPWAVTLVLLADFVPAMFLGPVFGAAADRWSRRRCMVVADALRALAFVGIAFVGGLGPTVAFALLAGIGSGLFTPAALAGLPSLVARERVPAATALFGGLTDVGYTAGPAIAAAGLLLGSPETLMVANGATFAISAVVLARLPLRERPAADRRVEPRTLVAQARRGVRAALRVPGVPPVIAASTAAVLFAGMFNVAELLLARQELGASSAAFSVLVGVFGLGVLAGSMSGAGGGSRAALKRRFLAGLALLGGGLVAAGLAPSYALALAAFAVAGAGNGVVLVHERLLLQATVADGLLGRVFGLKDAASSWGIGLSFVAAGALLSVLGTREVVVAGGLGALGAAAVCAWSLRGAWAAPSDEPAASAALPPLVDPVPGPAASRRPAPVLPETVPAALHR